MVHLFVAWGGAEAEEIAQWLCAEVFGRLPGTTTFVSSLANRATKGWSDSILQNLDAADAGIGILTRESMHRPWLSFELGYIRARNKPRILLNYDVRVEEYGTHPLMNQNSFDALKLSELLRAVEELPFGDPVLKNQARARIKAVFDKSYLPKVNFILNSPRRKGKHKLLDCADALKDRISTSAGSSSGYDNGLCVGILGKMIRDAEGACIELSNTSCISAHYGKYPEFLEYLHREISSCIVDAVCVIGPTERYWSQNLGEDILRLIPSNSRRVFVVEGKSDLHHHFGLILRHATKYRVYVIQKQLWERVPLACSFHRNFSVISAHDGHKVVATYDTEEPDAIRSIRFSPSSDGVAAAVAAFDEILKHAAPVQRLQASPDSWKTIDVDRAFDDHWRRLSGLAGTSALHSDVIQVREYDLHEEDHPYYLDMLRSIVGRIDRYAKSLQRSVSVLEVGAGTGHLTKRLVGRRSVSRVVAVDNDTDSVDILKQKLSDKRDLEVVLCDILSYPSGKNFDVVVSSFAEHHIRLPDKRKYFAAIERLLVPGGIFVVGDEFLRDHDDRDVDQYTKALRDYHDYIIDVARSLGCEQFIPLEREAEHSGLDSSGRRVDFKISMDRYCEAALASGFRVVDSCCVSDPSKAPRVGGMYVLELRPGSVPSR